MSVTAHIEAVTAHKEVAIEHIAPMHHAFGGYNRPHSACATNIEAVSSDIEDVTAHIEAITVQIEDVLAHIEDVIDLIEDVISHIAPVQHA